MLCGKRQSRMLYKYRIHQTDGRVLDRADPYGYAMELRPNSASVLVDLDYAFKDAAWLQRRAERPHYNEPWFREMHGSWRRKADRCPAGWYSYEALCVASFLTMCRSMALPMWNSCR